MARPSFARGLLFALLAAMGAVPWLLTAGAVLGENAATSLYALGLLVAHPAFAAPKLRQGIGAAVLVLALVVPIALFRPSPAVVLALTPGLLGILRSGMLFPKPLARALWFEAAFAVPGVLAASFFYDHSIFGTALAIWAYWLVQAGFVLTAGEEPRAPTTGLDPFTQAQRSALEVLERPPLR